MLLLSSNKRHWWLIPTSLFAGFLWQAWPHSYTFRLVAPDAILLVMLYWSLRRPHNLSPGVGFIVGLFRDVMDGSLLGQHALAMTLTIYFAQLFTLRLRMFAIWQQGAIVGLLAAFYLLCNNWVYLLTHPATDSTRFLWSAVTTGLCWPACYLILILIEQGNFLKPSSTARPH